MNWQQLVNDALPPWRGDEPTSLRQDIADELSDHFSLATRRELLRTGDETKARRAANEKFGDLKKIARQLWFDAMKEKIMKDRLMMVTMAAMVVVCIGMATMMWTAIGQQQQFNATLLAKIQTVAHVSESLPFDWGKLKVRVVDEKNRQPVEGATVQLIGKVYNSETAVVTEMTDAQGLVDYGAVHVGSHSLKVSGLNRYHLAEPLTVKPGSEHIVEIVHPDKAPRSKVMLDFTWPQSWREQGFVLCIGFTRAKGRSLTPQGFGRPRRATSQLGPSRNLEGHQWVIDQITSDDHYRVLMTVDGQHRYSLIARSSMDGVDRWNTKLLADVGEGLEVLADSYHVTELIVLRPDSVVIEEHAYEYVSVYDSRKRPSGTRGRAGTMGAVGGMRGPGGGMMGGRSGRAGATGGLFGGGGVSLPELVAHYQRDITQYFTCAPGEVNHWKIELPEGLADHVKAIMSLPQQAFLGRWELPGGSVAFELQADGRCVLTENGRSIESQWHTEGQKAIIATPKGTVPAWREGTDRLMVVKKKGTDPMPFLRVKKKDAAVKPGS